MREGDIRGGGKKKNATRELPNLEGRQAEKGYWKRGGDWGPGGEPSKKRLRLFQKGGWREEKKKKKECLGRDF